jgi:hypothetical protein
MLIIKAKELQVGDVVRRAEDSAEESIRCDPWGTCIVKRIQDGQITLWRPYGTTTDVRYSFGVICLIGCEEFVLSTNREDGFYLIERKVLK